MEQETPPKEDGYSALLEFIEDPKVTSPVVLASRNILKEDLEKTLEESLTPRTKKIIKMRFGLEDGIDHTLEEIGREVGF